MKTVVRILRGRQAGREGFISGTLADRAARRVTRALVHIDGEEPELYATSSLAEDLQLGLFTSGPSTIGNRPPSAEH